MFDAAIEAAEYGFGLVMGRAIFGDDRAIRLLALAANTYRQIEPDGDAAERLKAPPLKPSAAERPEGHAHE